jgi:hypothetical protein
MQFVRNVVGIVTNVNAVQPPNATGTAKTIAPV